MMIGISLSAAGYAHYDEYDRSKKTITIGLPFLLPPKHRNFTIGFLMSVYNEYMKVQNIFFEQKIIMLSSSEYTGIVRKSSNSNYYIRIIMTDII